jgi:hypothetical protein
MGNQTSTFRSVQTDTENGRMSDHGHVKLSRKFFARDPMWNEAREFSRAEAWIWLIQSAAWGPYRKLCKRSGVIEIGRGETPPLAERYLADTWGWGSKNRAARFLSLLLELGQIRTGQRTADGTTYVLVNYDSYQTTQAADGPHDGPETDQTRTKIEAVKQVKAKKENPAWPQRAGALWIERFGGTAHYARIGKALKPLVGEHGEEKVLVAWTRYLAEADEEFASPQAFAGKFGRWANGTSSRHEEVIPLIRNSI